MKKIHLLLTALLLCAGVKGQERDALILHSPQDYQVYGISPNGKWATGVYVNMNNLCYGFRWDLTTGETILLSGDNCQSEGSAVSDDGTVVGMFDNPEATDNGAPAYTAGYWKNGSWHHLPNIADAPVTTHDEVGYANAISANGEYIGGCYNDKSSHLIPLIWKDGKIAHTFTPEEGYEGMIYTVSADGQRAAGWSVTPNSEQARVATVWEVGKGATLIMDEGLSNAWCSARKFSPNGKWLLFWEGYYDTPADQITDPTASNMALRALYNMETGEKTDMPTITRDPFNFDVFDITDSGTVVGYESPETTQIDQAVIFKDGKTRWLYDYLQEKGVDLDADSTILRTNGSTYFIRGVGISNDEKTYAVLYYDTKGALCSMVIKLDEDLTTREPVRLKVRQLTGTTAARISWSQPLAGASGVTGYNLYRNGVKVNDQPLTTANFTDNYSVVGQHSYHVTALYGETESKPSASVVLDGSTAPVQAPRSLFARQVGYNDALLQWDVPKSNLTVVNYYPDGSTVTGFGGGNNSFEAAICIPAEEAAFYAGSIIHSVSFYPMTAQTGWKVNIYKQSKAEGAVRELLLSEPIGQLLAYGKENVVKLATPVTVPSDADLLVAIEVTVPADHVGYNVLGEVSGDPIPGQTDLLRMTSEPDFYSLYKEGQKYGATQLTTWAIAAQLSQLGGDASQVDVIRHYAVYDGDAELGTTSGLTYSLESLSDGLHSLGVKAVYADGRTSDMMLIDLDVKANASVFKAISDVQIARTSATTATFSWKAPADNDETFITHCTDVLQGGVLGPVENNYNYIAAADYDAAKLRGYEGYRVEAFRFMPLTEAVYTFLLEKDGVVVAEQDVEEYTPGLWNTVRLTHPVIIEGGSTYRLMLDCYDVEPQTAPLGLDARLPFTDVSDLYSVNDGATFATVGNASAFGNWMMGLVAVNPEEELLPVQGYNVRINNVQANESLLTAPGYTHQFSDGDATYRMNVDVLYEVQGTVKGQAIFFQMGPNTIGGNCIAVLRVEQADSYIRVTGEELEGLSLVNISGQIVSSAQGSELDITALPAGTYVLLTSTPQGVQSRKLQIVR